MKKLVSLVLALAMILSLTTFATAAETESSWGAKALETVYDLDIMRGDQNGDLHLTEYLTREEMFSLMYRLTAAVGLMDTAAQSTWNMYATAAGSYVGDMSSVSFWAVPYAAYNWVNRIFTGDDKGNLKPQGTLSYYDCATVLLRALGYENTLLLANGQWRLNVLQYGMEAGLWNHMSVTDLNAPITRANIAVMVYNALQARKVTCTTSAAGVTTYTINANTLIETNFGFDNVSSIVSKALVIAYSAANKKVTLQNGTQKTAAQLGLADADLPGLYGQVITWVAKSNDKVLKAAEVENVGWTELSLKGGASIAIDAEKGYKADGTTEIAIADAACVYYKVTINGTKYAIVKAAAAYFASANTTYYSAADASLDSIEEIKTAVANAYPYVNFTLRFTGGAFFCDVHNRKIITNYDDANFVYSTSTGKVTTSAITGASVAFAANGNPFSTYKDGAVLVIDYDTVCNETPKILSVVELAKTPVNGGLLTASYSGGNYGSVKLNGSAMGVTNGLTANSLAAVAGTAAGGAPDSTSLYALPNADDNGEKLGYIYALEGYIVHASTGNFSTTTPVTPSEDYYIYVTAAPTYTFDGALMKVSVTGIVNGGSTTRTISLPNAAALGDTADNYTIAEAGAIIAAGKLVFVDYLNGTVAATGQKVDLIANYTTGFSAGYVTRWININYGSPLLNTLVDTYTGVSTETPYGLEGHTEFVIGATDYVYYRDALVQDNVDGGTAGNTIDEDLTADITLAKLCKTMYYTYTAAGKTYVAFFTNAGFKSDVRSTWDNGTPSVPTGTTYMLLSATPSMTLEADGDVVTELTGYVSGVKRSVTVTVKTGNVSELNTILVANELVKIVTNETTKYSVCTAQAGEAYNSGYVIRYVNEVYDNLKNQIRTSYGTTILKSTSNQTFLGMTNLVEERIETLELARQAFNSANTKDYTLAQLAKTTVLQYTVTDVDPDMTYIVFAANSYDSAKRTEFDNWMTEHASNWQGYLD